MNEKKRIVSADLSQYSTFRIGGKADSVYSINTKADLENAFQEIMKHNQRFLCVGGGSNILFSDKGFRGAVLFFENRSITESDDGLFECEAGSRIPEIFSYTKKHGYDFSVFSTIPGTIGGATAGNAGLPSGEIKDIFVHAEVFDTEQNQFFIANANFFRFQYRHTAFHDPAFAKRYIIWKVWIQLNKKNSDAIAEEAKQYLQKRKATQPWGRTGGSFFKNPTEGAAGYFLEQAGMKGFKHGGAFFSEKHANFMMNDGTATQSDIWELGKIAQQKVLDLFNVKLIREVKMIDEFGNSL